MRAPMVKSQFLMDLTGWVLAEVFGQAAPVTRMSEPMRPV